VLISHPAPTTKKKQNSHRPANDDNRHTKQFEDSTETAIKATIGELLGPAGALWNAGLADQAAVLGRRVWL